jgi:ABC-2 type transport system ATP-binding protein
MAPAIRTSKLRKDYGRQTVLDGVDLEVDEGEVLALLGPNGAGKTTTVHILSTLLRPDGGNAEVGGFDVVREPDRVRSVIGLTGQFAAVDGLLTGEENLRLMARLRHVPRSRRESVVRGSLERFDLTGVARKPLSTYSGGLRRRLDLAMTLVGSPRIVVLDEPTTGLDPRSRRGLWELVRELVAEGTTVLLTTQYLEEADALADHVAVLDAGRVVARGTPDDLKRSVGGGHLRLGLATEADVAAAVRLLGGEADGLDLRVPLADPVDTVRRTLDRLDSAGVRVVGLEVRTADLDDVFLAVTGNSTTGNPSTGTALEEAS